MQTGCDCETIEVENCPPYLTVDTFLEHADRACANCSATDVDSEAIGQIPSSSFVDTYGLDRCCPVLTVYRKNQVIYSFDGGQTWIETGTAFSQLVTNIPSALRVANTATTIDITLANTTIQSQEREMVDIDSNNIRILETGNYLINTDFFFFYGGATNLVMTVEYMQNSTTSMSPYRQAHTMVFNGAAPIESAAVRYMKLAMLRRFTANQSFQYKAFHAVSAVTTDFIIRTRILKLSN